jgi:hypothetical protein
VYEQNRKYRRQQAHRRRYRILRIIGVYLTLAALGWLIIVGLLVTGYSVWKQLP